MTLESGSLASDIANNFAVLNQAVGYKDVPLVSNVVYRLEFEKYLNTDCAIVIFKFYDPTDSTVLATISTDLYAASSTYTTYHSETFTLNYLPGIHIFRVRVDCTTKNGSSSGYYARFVEIAKIRFVSL